MPNREDVNFASPANAAVLAYLHIDALASADFTPADEVHALGLGMSLGTHPDLVDYFWGLAEGLAARGGVINGRSSPILVNPASGVIFGLAGGRARWPSACPSRNTRRRWPCRATAWSTTTRARW